MAVAGLLAQYLSIKSQLSYYEVEKTKWDNLAAAMTKKVSQQETYETKWESASDTIATKWGDENGNVSYNGTQYLTKGIPGDGFEHDNKDELATSYANVKASKFDPDLLEEYTSLDMEYSTMQNMYDTLIDELTEQANGLKEQLGTEAQDTHLLSGS